MLNVFLALLVAFVITYLSIPAIIKVAEIKQLFDMPDGRKIHTRPIASLGGIGIFAGFMVSLLLTVPNIAYTDLQYFAAAGIILFFTGVKDDILILSASKKFILQLAAAAVVIHFGNIRIDSMHGFLGIYQLPEAVSLLLSYTTIIVVVNAFNLIDGIDGLAGSLGILTTSIFGIYFLLASMPELAILSFAMMGSLLAFLRYNLNPARIFMGDSGSLVLGLMNAILVIKFITVADYSTGTFPLDSSVAIGFSILLIPLFDTLRVFGIRIYNGKSPFSPDRNHIHHLLLNRGLTHMQITAACVLFNLSVVLLTYFGRMLGSTILLSVLIPLCFALMALIRYHRKMVETVVIAPSFNHSNAPSATSKTKVVALQKDIAAADQ